MPAPTEPTPAAPPLVTGDTPQGRLPMLDGWRAISILAVMAGHMLPLGPHRWLMNAAVAELGMAIFFTLSGFLIVSILHRDQNILTFMARRLGRIVPLAWATIIVALAMAHAPVGYWTANLLFFANLPPFYLDYGAHFWSLGAEMQFYVAIAIAVGLFGRRGLWLVPVAALTVTGLRIHTHTIVSIVTWLRVDEILAGGILALAIHSPEASAAKRILRAIPFLPVMILFVLSTDERTGPIGFLRPYLCATMVGITIVRRVAWLSPWLHGRVAAYLANISYALYIFHPYTLSGWLGSGNSYVRLFKRVPAIALAFAAAYISTNFFERPINKFVHDRTRRAPPRQPAPTSA